MHAPTSVAKKPEDPSYPPPPHLTYTANCSHDETDEFGRICSCSSDGSTQSCCRYRRNWASLSSVQRQQYISAVLTVASDPTYRPLYQTLIAKYHTSFNTLAQSTEPEISHFIPWHRYFLLEYESLLRLIHKNLTVPYWDWSASPSSPYTALVFHPSTGFGNTSDPETGCVTTGPFHEGNFNITSPNMSAECLTREHKNHTFVRREILNKSLSLPFRDFHNFVQLFLTLNSRCIVGGEMCSTNAASDPLFLLHLARVDLFVRTWQEQDGANSVVQESSKADKLEHTLADGSLLVSDFSSNDELPFGACVKYAPLDPVGVVKEREGSANNEVLHCAPMDELRRAAGSLSEQATQYITRTCGSNT